MPQPLASSNPRIAAVKQLQTPRGRREAGRYLVEGPLLLEEARRSGVVLEACYATERGAGNGVAQSLERDGIPLFIVDERTFARISDVETPTGLLGVAPTRYADLSAMLAGTEPILLLAGVADPGNAGTLVRTAEAFGVSSVIFGAGGVEPYGPKVVRAAMGALFRANVVVARADTLITEARLAGRPIVATALDGEPLPQFVFPPRTILAVGNERHGVASWLPGWDRALAIPQIGQTESLNAAIAGSIVLYELAKQTRFAPTTVTDVTGLSSLGEGKLL